ncbi:hypothetical protein BU15DRAFT_43880 [Melanogaster broomeanus]|nr:hypothetical protein BU15DRAFT_43880 [Melanogaster broomeanus]
MSESRSSEDSRRQPRTLILCFDGTNGQYDSTNTNVVKFYGLLRKDLPDEQVSYYQLDHREIQAGIGTYIAPGVVSPLWTWFAQLMDQAVAWYLDAHVMEGYKFLMDTYRPGDKICLFGFSRGAYTARALAGMLNKVGLLTSDNVQQVTFAYKAYKATDKEGIKLAAGFKQTFSQAVTVDFVGVWDTVESTGVLVNRTLPFTASNTSIRVFRQALALDEHRSRFRPNLYHWATPDNEPDENQLSIAETAVQKLKAIKSAIVGVVSRSRKSTPVIQQTKKYGTFTTDSGREGDVAQVSDGDIVCEAPGDFVPEQSSSHTDVLEVWFSGCHSDVGGGNVQDDVKVSLAQIPLRWMVEQVIESQCGIHFDTEALARIGYTTPPRDSDPQHPDALAPLYDELQINKMWWVLEIAPFSYAWQDTNGVWHTTSINMGKGRFIPIHQPKFHHTVKERMDYQPLSYTPRAVYDHHEVYV